MSFERWIVACCDRFLSQRTFELVVEPALADLQFEQSLGRRSWIATRGAGLRAVAGGFRDEMARGAGGFLTLTLLTAAYYVFPIAVSASLFKTWSGFFAALIAMFLLSLTPVLVCFWPSRQPVRRVE
jgi:hypothetical protein